MLTRLQLDEKFYIQFSREYSWKYTREWKQMNLINEIKQNTITDYWNVSLNYNRNNNDKPYGHTM